MTKKAIVIKGIVFLGGFLLLCSLITANVLADWALVPKTGQTTSFATGDDGDLEKGVAWPNPRFTNNGDGSVTDNLTGLIWMRNANCFGNRTWLQALSDCNNLNTGECGLTDGSSPSDWRLPNRNEFLSLFHLGFTSAPALSNTTGTGQWSEGNPFINVMIDNYRWTSTRYAWGGERVWCANIFNGDMNDSSPTNDLKVWCIRGITEGPAPVRKTGQTTSYATRDDGDLEMGVAWPNPRFTINTNGTVRDNLTGLVWLRNFNCFGEKNWLQHVSDCNNLNTGECGLTDGSSPSDWRLPNRNELDSLSHLGFDHPGLPNTTGTGQYSQGNPFNNLYWRTYISSTTYGPTWDPKLDMAWDEDWAQNWLGNPEKTTNYLANTCVRGGDLDEDGFPDHADNCPNDYNPGQEDTDGSGIGDLCNDALDADGDEWENNLDNCPNDSNPGQEDADTDTVGDLCDNCPDNANPGQEDIDTDTIGDVCDNCTDTDNDGYGNPGYTANTCPDDNCPNDSNPGQEDTDGSGIGDMCNEAFDADGDEWEGGLDNCPDDYNPNQEDLGDADGVGDICDNCPSAANPEQEDLDTDTIGDVCDTCTDTDNDGYGNPGYAANTCPDDNCPYNPNPEQEDTDGDGIGDICEDCTDTDNDGYGNPGYPNPGCDDDNCPDDANPGQEDLDNDTIGDVCDTCTDTDNDGYGNPGYPANTCPDDNCPDDPNTEQEDTDSDTVGDICDECTDTDDDGYGNPGYPANTCPDDNCPDDPNPMQEDLPDGDGMGDLCDNCPDHPNGPLGGTCTKGNYGASCTVPGDNVAECGPNGYCSMAQEDSYPPNSGNACGDVCECEGNFDDDEDQDGTDAAKFKVDFGRSIYDNPCENDDPCNGDFECDNDCDGTDAATFKADFGRSQYDNPCPSCTTVPWCVYP